MGIQDMISEEVIKVPLISTEKFDVIRELVDLLHQAGKFDNADMVYQAVLDRESLGSTGLEKGIAVPHAKTTAVPDIMLAVGISPAGVDFDALDGEPSNLFFMILAPPDKSGPHIQLLTEIAGVARSQAFCRALRASQNSKEVVELFKEEF